MKDFFSLTIGWFLLVFFLVLLSGLAWKLAWLIVNNVMGVIG